MCLNLFHLLAAAAINFLNLFTMAPELVLTCLSLTSSCLSMIVKVPQILSIYKSKTVTGINRSSVLIALWNTLVTISYSAHFHYPSKLYGEYFGQAIQEIIIISFVVSLSSQKIFPTNRHMVLLVAASIIIHLAVGLKLVPSIVPIGIITTGLPSGIISRVMQIHQILNDGDSGSVSAMTWFLAFVMTFCRFWSNFLTVCDPILLFKVGSAMVLNLVLTVVVVLHKKGKSKQQ